MPIIFWLPAFAALLHVSEEFLWPGGFPQWFRDYRPENRLSFTRGFAIATNGTLIAAGCVLGWIGPEWSRAVSLWLVLAAILAANTSLHLLGSWRTRRYSPGMVSGILVNVPLCAWGCWHFVQSGEATGAMVAFSLALGASYDIWSNLLHRARSAWMEQRHA
jgi:hypothetical protein